MEVRFCDLFTSYEMELETHVYVQIETNQGFMNYKLHVMYGMVCQYGMMLVSQGIVWYDMVWYVSMV